MKTIIISIDFSKGTEKLIAYANDFLAQMEAKVILLHVAGLEDGIIDADPSFNYLSKVNKEELKREIVELDRLKTEFTNPKLELHAKIKQGIAEEEILKYASEIDADFIMIAKKKHDFLYKTFVGSVGDALLENSKIPLILVPV